MSETVLENHASQPLPLVKKSQDQVENLLKTHSLAISLSSEIDLTTVLNFLVFYSSNRSQYYLRINECDFQHLLEEMKILSSLDKTVKWELVVNREGLGRLHIKKKKHHILIEIELVGAEEDTTLAMVDPTPPFDDI